jgi:hypothetical protein
MSGINNILLSYGGERPPDLLTNATYGFDMDSLVARYGGTPNLIARTTGTGITSGVTGFVSPQPTPLAYEFSSSEGLSRDDIIHLAFSCNYNASRHFAFEFWFKFRALPTTYSGTADFTDNVGGSYFPRAMYFGADYDTQEFSLRMAKSITVLYDVIPYFTFGSIPNDTNWHQIVLVFDISNETFDFYLDNVVTSFTSSIYNDTATGYTGVTESGLRWRGDKTILDIWRAWSGLGSKGKKKALEEQDVDYLWNGGAGLDYSNFI